MAGRGSVPGSFGPEGQQSGGEGKGECRGGYRDEMDVEWAAVIHGDADGDKGDGDECEGQRPLTAQACQNDHCGHNVEHDAGRTHFIDRLDVPAGSGNGLDEAGIKHGDAVQQESRRAERYQADVHPR